MLGIVTKIRHISSYSMGCISLFKYIYLFFYDSGARPAPIGGPKRLTILPMPKTGPGFDKAHFIV